MSYSTVGIIILLTLIAVLSMTAIWSLNDQHGCRSFCIPALDDSLSLSMSSDSMPMCSSSSIAILISSAIMQSGMSMHDSIALIVMHMPRISSSLFCGCVWIANLQWIPVAQACIVFLHCIAVFLVVYFKVSDRLAKSVLNIAAIDLWSVFTLTSWVKQ